MGRSYHKDNINRERTRVNKKMSSTKNTRHHDKEHLREITSGNISSDDFLDIEEDDHERKLKHK